MQENQEAIIKELIVNFFNEMCLWEANYSKFQEQEFEDEEELDLETLKQRREKYKISLITIMELYMECQPFFRQFKTER